jgi:hypothetical protein
MKSLYELLSGMMLEDFKAEQISGEELDTRVDALKEMYSPAVKTASPTEFKEVLTTAHFSNYFSDALSRMFYSDYRVREMSWTQYTYADSAPSFRDVDRLRLSRPGTLYKRREKGEAKATSVGDSQISYGVEEYARQFDVSWRVILEDDLGKIREVPRAMARAAVEFENQFVTALFDNATTQAALSALGAQYAGTGALTHENLAIGITQMNTRTDPDDYPLSVGGIYLVVPPDLSMQAEVILGSTLMSGSASNDVNVIPKFLRGYIVNDQITTTATAKPWYLFADPSAIPAVPVVRLQGFEEPFVYMRSSNIDMVMGSAPPAMLMGSYETGDIEYTVEDFIGGWDDDTYVGVVDYRGIYYSDGTAE